MEKETEGEDYRYRGLFWIITSNKILEIYVWILLSFLVAGRPLFYGFNYGFQEKNFFLEFYTEILSSILVLLFPFLFKLIYDEFPFEYIRNKKKQSLKIIKNQETSKDSKNDEELDQGAYDDIALDNNDQIIIDSVAYPEIEDLHILNTYLINAQRVSDKIYNRTNAYLLIGCLIAFAGVLFFYFQAATIHTTIKPDDDNFYSKLFVEYLPRIGTLIFVETIAFFFLRQYRLTMEEFRYYEAIKRQRENQYAVFKLINDYKDKPELFEKLISYCEFTSNPNKFMQGETNSIIEVEKIIPKDTEIFDKFLELFKLYKK
ncbi:hypothetical protein HYN59_06285 [Flavobacterium album]|uniref:Uncharacterized protein n=1 Tax=Flavobacterium album TaxID=2175091 RepID=A0A2S1QWJ5_9FLAO|nr:hypothetical protein [Flavobacterium album]AWH84753.1 hypothetical protein HYN59_06285 [Flavobacterium album]